MSWEFQLGGLQVSTLPEKLSGLHSLPKGVLSSAVLGRKKVELTSDFLK